MSFTSVRTCLWSVQCLCYIFPFPQPSQNDDKPFHLTAEKLEHALQKAKKEVIHRAQNFTHINMHTLAFITNYPACLFFQGVNIKAVILVNPHNPLGEIYTSEEMISFLNCAKRSFY